MLFLFWILLYAQLLSCLPSLLPALTNQVVMCKYISMRAVIGKCHLRNLDKDSVLGRTPATCYSDLSHNLQHLSPESQLMIIVFLAFIRSSVSYFFDNCPLHIT